MLAIGALAIVGTAALRRRQGGRNFFRMKEPMWNWLNRFNFGRRFMMNPWAKKGRRIIRNMNWT